MVLTNIAIGISLFLHLCLFVAFLSKGNRSALFALIGGLVSLLGGGFWLLLILIRLFTGDWV